MSFTSTVTTFATVGSEGLESPPPAWAFGVTAFACFVVLLGVLWSFRNTAARYDKPARVNTARQGDTHGPGSQRATDHGAHR